MGFGLSLHVCDFHFIVKLVQQLGFEPKLLAYETNILPDYITAVLFGTSSSRPFLKKILTTAVGLVLLLFSQLDLGLPHLELVEIGLIDSYKVVNYLFHIILGRHETEGYISL